MSKKTKEDEEDEDERKRIIVTPCRLSLIYIKLIVVSARLLF